jgi:hypothetical protein
VAGPPSVVLLDDGELERVRVILERLGVEFALCRRVADAAAVPRARDLLVSTGRRALAMPELGERPATEAPPLWLCIHGQDFDELRAKLRALGVSYLVHSAVDQESLRLLIEMLLHGQHDRRTASRLPVGCEVSVRVDRALQFGKLLDLSRGGARLRTETALAVGDRVDVELPQELRGRALAKLSGRVARVERCPAPGGRSGFSVAVELEPLSPEAARDLDAILSGANPATRISALSAPRKRERRSTERRAYRRRVAALSAADAGTPRVALGHDLSVAGIRIARQPGLMKGMQVAIGLYGAEGGVPLALDAEVVADHGPRGLGLAFRRVSAEQRGALEKLVAALPLLESLASDGDGGPALIVSSVVAQKA